MLVMKSYFLSEKDRLKMEATVFDTIEGLSHDDILSLDDRELMELLNTARGKLIV
ncbi:hypothetical protein AB1K84_09230 [Mesobacillus foraminis]|jgi:hypothetical protein|uniref:Fur-regulated basic protein A n=1 Tax=Mesobacillus foraminis TaxID=279826 RepID=A0A4R2BIL6_9BACI|nr:hypothetical protein [Mesobacillus foraminis]TCN25919.1 hypothetical protein EV146_10424 [Mesobacillus foraminis]